MLRVITRKLSLKRPECIYPGIIPNCDCKDKCSILKDQDEFDHFLKNNKCNIGYNKNCKLEYNNEGNCNCKSFCLIERSEIYNIIINGLKNREK